MLRFAIGVAALLITTGQMISHSAAADLPRPMQPPPVYVPEPVRGWSGFYLGGNVGGGWGTGDSDFSAGAAAVPFATIKNSLSGVIGGAQLGYNWQTGPLVYGLEADFQYSGLRGELDAPACSAAVCGVALSAKYKQNVTWFGTARGRLGYADAGWLAYLTGGYAYAQLETEASATAGAVTATVSSKDTRGGWTLGGGVEVMLTPNWSARAEYLHLDFGSKSGDRVFPALTTITDNAGLTMEVVRAGVNYRF